MRLNFGQGNLVSVVDSTPASTTQRTYLEEINLSTLCSDCYLHLFSDFLSATRRPIDISLTIGASTGQLEDVRTTTIT